MLSSIISFDPSLFAFIIIAAPVFYFLVRSVVRFARNVWNSSSRPRYTVTVEQAKPDTKTAEREEKKHRRRYQAAQELERVQAEFDEQRELNEIIIARFEQIAEEKRKADVMNAENPALLAKYEKVLRQRIASQNKMRSLQRNIEKLTDIANGQF